MLFFQWQILPNYVDCGVQQPYLEDLKHAAGQVQQERELFFYFHRALSHPENLYLFWLSAISVRPKMANCGTKNFQGDDPDYSGWFWYRTNFLQCSQSLEKEQSLCGFNVLPPSSPESSDPRSLIMCYEWEIPVEDVAFPFYVNCT